MPPHLRESRRLLYAGALSSSLLSDTAAFSHILILQSRTQMTDSSLQFCPIVYLYADSPRPSADTMGWPLVLSSRR